MTLNSSQVVKTRTVRNLLNRSIHRYHIPAFFIQSPNRTYIMQFTTSTLLCIVTIASLPIRSDATFQFLFDRLLSPLVGPACDLAQQTLGLQDTATCTCDLDYQGVFRGFEGDVNCVTTSTRCLVQPDLFCASGTIDFELAAGLFVDTGLNSNITACFDVKSGFPDGIVELDNEVCFEFATKGLAFDACTVTIGTNTCQECTICESGVDFKFNCTNVDLETANADVTIPGPATATCLGLSAVPTDSLV